MTLLVNELVEIRRLAGLMATARVLAHRAGSGQLHGMTAQQAADRHAKADAELILYLESLRDPEQGIHPDNARAMGYWDTLVGLAVKAHETRT